MVYDSRSPAKCDISWSRSRSSKYRKKIRKWRKKLRMIDTLRKEFNEHFTRERYDALVNALSAAANCTPRFRIAESPIFLSREFVEGAARSAEEILIRAASPELQQIGEQAI